MQLLTKNKRFIAAFLLAVFSFTFTVNAGVPNATKKVNFTGRQLFEGIFFGLGPVAQKLPELKQIFANAISALPEDQQRLLRENETAIADEITRENPTAFDGFQNALSSTDYARIEKALMEMSETMTTASYVLFVKKTGLSNLTKDQYNKLVRDHKAGGSEVAVTILVAVNIAIVAEIVVAFLATVLAAKGATPAETTLQKEMLVNSIITNLNN